MMFKTIGFKVSAAIFVVLLISFIVMQVILNLDFKNTANKMSKANLNTVSTSVFQTMRMAMNLGDPEKIKEYFALEGAVKNGTAKVPHAIDPDYWMHFTTFPKCSGTAMGIDRLIAVLAGCKTIEPYLPFSFTLE